MKLTKEQLIERCNNVNLKFIRRDGEFVIANCEKHGEVIRLLKTISRGGCQKCGRERSEYHKFKHGNANTRLYTIWKHIKERCNKPYCKEYSYYGGRGITICDDWLKFIPFYEWSIKNGYDYFLEIDRIDNNKGYYPENCRFVTKQENGCNKRNNVLLTYNGKTQPISKWSRETGIKYATIRRRVLELGWEHEKALTTKV